MSNCNVYTDSRKKAVIYFVLFDSIESWFSGLKFCQKQGGSLPQLEYRDDVNDLLVDKDFHDVNSSYAVFIGLKWVSGIIEIILYNNTGPCNIYTNMY